MLPVYKDLIISTIVDNNVTSCPHDVRVYKDLIISTIVDQYPQRVKSTESIRT